MKYTKALDKAFESVFDYKFGDGNYEAAREACEEFAEESGISYERACSLVMELI